jgi:hypothetical protein
MVLLVLLTFAITRFLMLRFPEGRNSTAFWLFASYGFEAVAASERNVSVYRIRASIVTDSLRGSASTIPGAGVIEYPPLAISWLALPARVIGGSRDGKGRVSASERKRYSDVLRIELAVIDVICLCLLAITLRRSFRASYDRTIGGLASYVFCTSLMFTLLLDRLDLVLGALILIALALLSSSLSIAWSFVVLGLAVSFKVVALLIAPVWLIGSLPCGIFRKSLRQRLAAYAGHSASLAVVFLLPIAPYWLRDGRHSFDFLQYHSQRGVQIESLIANGMFLLRPLGLHVDIARQFGSADVIAPGAGRLSVLFTIAMVGALGAAVAKMRREVVSAAGRFPDELRVARAMPALCAKYTVLSLVIGMCGAKVFSPQYLLWILPLGPLVILYDRRADVVWQGAVAFVCFASLLVWPLLYSEVRPHAVLADGSLRFYPPTSIGVATLSMRSVALLWLTVSLWRQAARDGPLERQVSS